MHYVIYNKSDTKDTPNSHIRTGYNYSFTVDKLQVNCDYGQKLYSVITTFRYTLHPKLHAYLTRSSMFDLYKL